MQVLHMLRYHIEKGIKKQGGSGGMDWAVYHGLRDKQCFNIHGKRNFTFWLKSSVKQFHQHA